MGTSIAGSLIAAGVCAQAAIIPIPRSGGDQPALVFVDRDGRYVRSATCSPGDAVRPAGPLHRVSHLIGGLFASWSAPNAQALRDAYEDPTTYHDRGISREAVLEDKRRFAEPWPQRTYTVRPGTLLAQRGDDSRTCTGTTDWASTKDTKRSTGAAGLKDALPVGQRGLTKIAEETGKVVRGPIVPPAGRGNPRRAANKTACAADEAEISRGNIVCRN